VQKPARGGQINTAQKCVPPMDNTPRGGVNEIFSQAAS